MLSAVIRNGHSYRAMPLAGQLVHHGSAHPGPLVLGATPLNSPARTLDRDRLFVTRPAGFCSRWHPASPQGSDHIFSLARVRRMACEDSSICSRPFLLIVRTRRVVTGRTLRAVARDSRSSQHLARFVLGLGLPSSHY